MFLLGVPAALLGFIAVLLTPELALRGTAPAAAQTTPAPDGPTPTADSADLLLAGLVLALVAERARTLEEGSALTATLARLVPDQPGTPTDRAAVAVDRHIRPLAALLLRHATGMAHYEPVWTSQYASAVPKEPAQPVYPN